MEWKGFTSPDIVRFGVQPDLSFSNLRYATDSRFAFAAENEVSVIFTEKLLLLLVAYKVSRSAAPATIDYRGIDSRAHVRTFSLRVRNE